MTFARQAKILSRTLGAVFSAKMNLRSLRARMAVLLTPVIALVVTRALGQAPAPDAPAASQPAAEQVRFLRIDEKKNQSIELQIAVRDYARADGGPRVGLVAVAHLGEKSFYRSVQQALDAYDVVLYESVKPPGTTRPGGETAEQRIESTRAAMRFVGGLIAAHLANTGAHPEDLAALRTFAGEQDPRLAQSLDVAMIDAWGRPLKYGKLADASGEPTFALTSLGADGAIGGGGENADLDLGDEAAPDPLALSKDDGLQQQLADALNLEFQLEALDYSAANWRCSDMAMDELNRRLQARGVDFEVLGGTLAGTSLPARLIKVLLGTMKMLDAVTDGAITDTFKVVMIEMLGDPALIDVSLTQLGEGFGEVIINDRNQIAVDDLARIIEHEPQVKSVAILYGAGHMPDLDRRLRDRFGYEPVEGSEQWLTAMKVDLTSSALSPRDMNQIRAMIKQAIRQQMRQR